MHIDPWTGDARAGGGGEEDGNGGHLVDGVYCVVRVRPAHPGGTARRWIPAASAAAARGSLSLLEQRRAESSIDVDRSARDVARKVGAKEGNDVRHFRRGSVTSQRDV